MSVDDDNLDSEKFAEEGPRLSQNRQHADRCHSRWIKNMTHQGEWCEHQCGGCRFYIHLTGEFKSDWGVCTNPLSPRDGIVTFEHDGCDHFVACDTGWS